MSNDDFLERLRTEARTLRHQPDEITLARIRARIRERVERPRVADVLAAWLRPAAAAVGTFALIAAIGVAVLRGDGDTSWFTDTTIEISIAGDDYRVGN